MGLATPMGAGRSGSAQQSSPTSGAGQWSPPADEAIWEALVHDAAAAVAVFDASAHVVVANPLYLKMIGAKSIEAARALSIEQRLGHDMAEERLPILQAILRTGKPTMIRDLRRGWALLLTMRRVGDHVLATFRPADIPDWCDAHVTDVALSPIKHIDLGPLAALSEREKEILAFIGQGLTSAQIAKKLCRTVKTIEWHRSAIARKLNTKDRVALAKMAIQAGLCTPEYNQRLAAMEAGGTGVPD
jgi:DNA-binding NarL/FixJ family response regulator